MTRWLPFALVGVLVLALAWSIAATERADDRASVAEGKVAVFDSLRQVADNKARSDSLTLVRVTQETAARVALLDTQRLRARQESANAHREATVASGRLRAVLDSLGAPTAPLDSLLASHASEVASVERERDIEVAGRLTERTLRIATEEALRTERLAHQADNPVIAALQEQVAALKSVQRRKGLELWATRAAVVGVAVLTLR